MGTVAMVQVPVAFTVSYEGTGNLITGGTGDD